MTEEVTTATERVVDIYHADPIHRGESIAPVAIRIAQVVPPLSSMDPDGVREAKERFADDGRRLADALWSSLPGGTVDALLSEMFARKASQFRVRFAPVGGEGS